MTLWLILAILCALVAAALLLGLWPGRAPPPDRAEHDLAVYRAQLEELARDRDRGVIEEREYAAARREVERRLLAADAASAEAPDPAPAAAGFTWALGAAILVPAAAVGLYLWLGSPEIASQPLAARQVEPPDGDAAPTAADIEGMVAGLRSRLAEDPDDLEGWLMLGRSSAVLGRYDESVAAYEQATRLNPVRADALSALGEARLLAAGGVITEAAQQAFEDAVAADPGEPRARFYLAMARHQDGDSSGALADLEALLAEAPPDAAWAPRVREAAAALAKQLGQAPAASAAPAAPGGETGNAAAPEDQEAMIRSMVAGLAERLAEAPDDPEGWRMLGRSYQVLGELDKAAVAYGRLAALLPDEPEAQLAYAGALVDAAGPDGAAPPQAAEILEGLLQAEPVPPDALYYLGEISRRDGDLAAAGSHWRRLLGLLPPGSEEHAWLSTRIDALESQD